MENGKTELERTNRLLCRFVTVDGLKCGEGWPKCVDPLKCCERGGCFWRAFHTIPTDKMRLQTET